MKKTSSQLAIYIFAILSAIIVYGFALTNFTLTPDSEYPIDSSYSLFLGRWGTNIVRYHIFDGLYPYYTLLVGLFFLSLAAVEMAKLIKIEGVYQYVFILLFLSFPQHAYQLVFTMQADVIGIAYFLSVMAVSIFSNLKSKSRLEYVIKHVIIILLLLFSVASYQAIILIPIELFAIFFFTKWYEKEIDKRKIWFDVVYFIGFLIVSIILYYLSIKLIYKVDLSGGYLETYVNKDNNPLINFFKVFYKNIIGGFYYGERPYILVPIGIAVGILTFIKEKKYFWFKLLTFLFLFIFPFSISLFTKEEANPPRIFVGSTVVFAYIITYLFKSLKLLKSINILFIVLIIYLWNTFYITNLFYASNRIYKHDLLLAYRINDYIIQNFEDYNPKNEFVFFYGKTPQNDYNEMILPNSEIFAGSIFNWDNGNNNRIINFFSFNDIRNFRLLEDKNEFDKFKDSINSMPIFPKKGSIKKFNNTLVVKLSYSKGNSVFLQDEQDVDSIYKQKKVLKIEPFKIDLKENVDIMGGVDQFSQKGNKISLKGWVAYPKKPSDGTEISILLYNKNQSYVVETNREFRGDVSDYLNDGTDYNSSGYISEFDVSNLPKGSYEVRLRVKQLNSNIEGYKLGYKTIEVK